MDSDGKPCICIEIYYYITTVKTIDFYCCNQGKLRRSSGTQIRILAL